MAAVSNRARKARRSLKGRHPGRRGNGLHRDLPGSAGLDAFIGVVPGSTESRLLGACMVILLRGGRLTYRAIQAEAPPVSTHTVQAFLAAWGWWILEVLAPRLPKESATANCYATKGESGTFSSNPAAREQP